MQSIAIELILEKSFCKRLCIKYLSFQTIIFIYFATTQIYCAIWKQLWGIQCSDLFLFPKSGGDWIGLWVVLCLLYLLYMLDTVSNPMLVFYSLDRIRKAYRRKGNYSIISLMMEMTAVHPCTQSSEPQAIKFIYAEIFSTWFSASVIMFFSVLNTQLLISKRHCVNLSILVHKLHASASFQGQTNC